jgi:hypothetical protein
MRRKDDLLEGLSLDIFGLTYNADEERNWVIDGDFLGAFGQSSVLRFNPHVSYVLSPHCLEGLYSAFKVGQILEPDVFPLRGLSGLFIHSGPQVAGPVDSTQTYSCKVSLTCYVSLNVKLLKSLFPDMHTHCRVVLDQHLTYFPIVSQDAS